MSFGYGDVFDAVADAVQPDDPAIFCDGDRYTWGQFTAASNALARSFLAAGLKPGAKVAQYMRNSAGYPLVFVAAMKARLAPVNVNYRYGPDELAYLIDNSDAEIVVFDADYADNARALKSRMPGVKLWVCAGARINGFDFLDDLATGDGSKLDIKRSPDDMFLLYTGGTTGMPKGVMWPGNVWWDVLGPGRAAQLGLVLAIQPDAHAITAIPTQWDFGRIEQLLSNLLENSLRYTRAPGQVHVHWRTLGDTLQLTVEDSAPGVAAAQLGQLFDTLFRVDGARTRTGKHCSGLGLSIVRAIAQAHHGTVAASASRLGGLTIQVSLPLQPPQALDRRPRQP